ncbi:MAG: 6-phosphofructokinase [Clostridiales bacterium]|nr:6-phosphofructokinase [Clostridiales bacterium]
MKQLSGACIIGQSGGPSSVINASVLGCVEAALKSPLITKVYGAAHGITGVLDDKLYDLTQEDPAELALLRYTPSSALGSCRYKLKDFLVDDTDYKRILEIFKKYNVRYFFYNGGNDSMDTCSKISSYMAQNGYECNIIGIPKTIDNDLWGTDHCPGYGSAAKYVATTCMELSRDYLVYQDPSIMVIEIMGRNAGWLTAAASLAKKFGMGPDLVYLPEVPFDMASFMEDVAELHKKQGDVMIAVSEGIRDAGGSYISSYFTDTANEKDAFGHSQMGGLAANLANFIKNKLGVKVRGIEFSSIQRCASHVASATDIEEAYMAGKAAFEAAASGISDKMVAFKRAEGPLYKCETVLVDLADTANKEKMVPREWINEKGNGVLPAFAEYALPLIQGETEQPKEGGLPRFAQLKRIVAR